MSKGWWLGALLVLASPTWALETVTLQLKWLHQFQFAGYYAAHKLGYYQAYGLDVVIKPAIPGQTDGVAEVLAGDAQFAIGGSSLVLARQEGKAIVALAAMFQKSPSAWLWRTAPDRLHLAALKGQRIHFVSTEDAPELLTILRRAGLSLQDFTVVNSNQTISDLLSGQLDVINVYTTNEPYLLQQAGVDYQLLTTDQYGIYTYADVLFCSERYRQQHPNLVQHFVDASLQGWQYAINNPDDVIDWLLQDYGVTKSRAHLQFEAEQVIALVQAHTERLGQMNIDRWRQIVNDYQQLGTPVQASILPGFLGIGPAPSMQQQILGSWWSWALLLLLLVLPSVWLMRSYRQQGGNS